VYYLSHIRKKSDIQSRETNLQFIWWHIQQLWQWKVDQDEGFFHSKGIFTFLLRMTQILHTPKIMWVLVVLLNVLTLSIWSNLRFPLLDSQRIQRYDHNNLLTKFCSSYLLSHWPYDHYLYNIIKWMIFFSTYLRVAKIHWYSFGSYLQVKYKTNPSIFLSFVL
jgi:hypothetical protein